jgi:hypothetical protein
MNEKFEWKSKQTWKAVKHFDYPKILDKGFRVNLINFCIDCVFCLLSGMLIRRMKVNYIRTSSEGKRLEGIHWEADRASTNKVSLV